MLHLCHQPSTEPSTFPRMLSPVISQTQCPWDQAGNKRRRQGGGWGREPAHPVKEAAATQPPWMTTAHPSPQHLGTSTVRFHAGCAGSIYGSNAPDFRLRGKFGAYMVVGRSKIHVLSKYRLLNSNSEKCYGEQEKQPGENQERQVRGNNQGCEISQFFKEKLEIQIDMKCDFSK